MRLISIKSFYIIFLLLGMRSYAQKLVPYNDAHIRYMGRVGFTDDNAQLYASGTSLEVNFTGTSVKATIKDERGDNYFNVIIDGKITVFHPNGEKQLYTLATALPAGNHTLLFYKRSEFSDGTTQFYDFEFDTDATLLPLPPAKKRAIEFYGNSITAGYAVEDFSGQDSYLPRYKNNYISYAALTARHYDARYSFIDKSGIGVMVGYYPLAMPEIYDRLNPNDENSLWDFTKFTPDIVVVNLFQNDASMMRSPDRPEYIAKFGTTPPTEQYIITAYKKFILNLRVKYPHAQIICALGDMDACRPGSVWIGYIEKAVAQINDKNIFTFTFTFKNTPGHPTIKEHQTMADELSKFIDAHIKW